MRNLRSTVGLMLVCLLLSSCALLPRQRRTTLVVDPLIERNQKWQTYVERGNWALQNQDLNGALAAYQEAVAVKPDSSQVLQKIGEIYFQQQEYEKARDAFSAVTELDSRNVSARNYVGYIHEQLNNYQGAAEAFEEVLKIDSRNLYALNHLGLAYKQLNRLDDAEDTLRRALRMDPKAERPESRNLHNYLGLIYLERGEVGEAIAEFRESIRRNPDDVWARQNLAALYENNGRYYEAQLQYYEILQIAPNNLLAPERLQALSQLDRSVVVSADVSPVALIAVDVDELIANAPTAEAYPNADAVLLLNQFSHEVLPTGKSRYTSHQVVKLLTDRGVQQYDDIAIPYTPSAQYITVNVARTILPDGTVLEPPEEAYNDVTPPGLLSYNLYSDSMWRVISMPGLAPGVCIEYQVTLEDAGAESAGSASWFWGGFSFQSTDVTLRSNYALRVPKGTEFRWKGVNCELKPTVQHDETGSTYIWTYGETPMLPSEYNMPPTNDLVPRLTYSSVDSWESVYDWYKSLAKDRYRVDEKIEETVLQLTGDAMTPEDKIREIYHYVASEIRYVGIELGHGAYQPTPADEVFRFRYGDCKDKSTLLIAMLERVGIEAFPVLINPAPYEHVDVDIPSLGQFSHLIVAVPQANGSYIWLDATAETCSFGDLPSRNQGRKGFVIGRERGEFVDVPVYPPESNQLVVDAQLVLHTDGSIEGRMRVKTTGQYSMDSRLKYREVTPNALSDTLAAELSAQFPGVRVLGLSVSALEDLNAPVEIEVAFSAEDYLKSMQDYALCPMPNDEFTDYAEIFAAASRQFPLDLSYPMQMTKTVTISLPDGWTATLPSDREMVEPFGTMRREYRMEDNRIVYRLDFSLQSPTIAPEDYPAARRFFNNLAQEDKTQLILHENGRPKV